MAIGQRRTNGYYNCVQHVTDFDFNPRQTTWIGYG